MFIFIMNTPTGNPKKDLDVKQFLEDFIAEFGIDAVKKIVAEVNAMNLPGPTVEEYFAFAHSQYAIPVFRDGWNITKAE